MREGDDRLSDGGVEQFERSAYYVAVTRCVSGCSYRSAHRVISDQSPTDAHAGWYVGKRGDVDPDRRDSRGFEHSLDVPHGHVADGSNRDQQDGIDVRGTQTLDPRWGDVVTQLQL